MDGRATTNHVSAMFLDARNASRAVDALLEAGFRRNDVSLLMSEHTRARYFPEEPSRAPRGAALGGGLGAVAGGLVALVSLASPGGIVVAGPIAALLTGGATGAVGGGLLGALVGAGFSNDDARRYERWIVDGGMVVGVRCHEEEQARRAMRLMADAGAAGPVRHQRRRARERISQPAFVL